MFIDWFVFDLVIFSIINDYDGVVVILDGFGGVKGESKLAKSYGFNDYARFSFL